jgi:hypothetical protein
MDAENKFSAPYVPFSTFETGLDKLGALSTLPPRIDHTVFPSMGGIAKGQVISALKFFRLVDATGIPDPSLKELAKNKDGRKTAVRELIKRSYPNISEDDLAGASPAQLDAKLGDKMYNISGETKQKARTFLLKAAEYAGMEISSLLKTKGPRGPRAPRKTTKKSSTPSKATPSGHLKKTDSNGEKPSGTQRTIELNNGGTVTLSLNVNILELKGKDREFVFELIDKLDVYTQALPAD